MKSLVFLLLIRVKKGQEELKKNTLKSEKTLVG